MAKSHSLIEGFIALAFGIFLALPTEDLPETPYDESEALPYECAPLCSTVESVNGLVVVDPTCAGVGMTKCIRYVAVLIGMNLRLQYDPTGDPSNLMSLQGGESLAPSSIATARSSKFFQSVNP
jgi:hypothetical protein